jgi:hypothetical protein
MSDSLAKDGIHMTPQECEALLERMNQYEPGIQGIFHKYIEDCISRDRTLRTPLGRERIFFGLRPRGDNSKIFMEAYSYIPQSTVGDNTGLAVLFIECTNEDYSGSERFGKFPIVHECHDSITLELDDNAETINEARSLFVEAFDREFTFHNGITVQIPVEAELGYNLKDTISTEKSKEKLGLPKTVDDLQEDVVMKAYQMVRELRENEQATQKTLVGSVS